MSNSVWNYPLQVPSGWNGFTYVYQGSGNVSGTKAKLEQVKLV